MIYYARPQPLYLAQQICLSRQPLSRVHQPKSMNTSPGLKMIHSTRHANLTVVDQLSPRRDSGRELLPPSTFFDILRRRNIDFFTGVPDSLLKNFCAYLSDHAPVEKHIITANEGGAVSLAAGYHLGTSKSALVYMQNSGIGNATNPILSLAHQEIYGIPMLLLIGWRGEPGTQDEPQHTVQGRVTQSLLDDMNIPSRSLPTSASEVEAVIDEACKHMKSKTSPFALLVKRGTFAKYQRVSVEPDRYTLTREEALKQIISELNPKDITVATTGFTGRELYELRDSVGHDHARDFLTVGGMGHCSAIALGIAVSNPKRQVVSIDGDGALLMHMGTLATIGRCAPSNFRHVLINNGAHDSVGGQPTGGFDVDFTAVAKAVGYKHVQITDTVEGIGECIRRQRSMHGPTMLEIRVKQGARANLGRPKTSPAENKLLLMDNLRS